MISLTSISSPLRSRRGTTLAVVMALTMLISISALLMARTVLDQHRLNMRRRELSRADYAAQAGVGQIRYWGNNPTRYTPDTNLFQPGADFSFTNLKTAMGGSGLTITSEMLENMNLGTFTTQNGDTIANIDKIDLLPYDAAIDPVSCLFKIRSIGRSNQGLTRTMFAYIRVSPTIEIKLEAALISFNNAATFGNARVHWGQSWSKASFDMLNRSQMGYVIPSSTDYDPWVRYRTEGRVDFSHGGWSNSDTSFGSDLFRAATNPYPGMAPWASGNYNVFQQFVPAGTLKWPDIGSKYQTFKNAAIATGNYYYTDAAGNIYDNMGKVVNFMTKFAYPDRASVAYDLIFIDTVDKTAPKADGSNLATISVSGTGRGLKGIFWIGANFDGTGIGSPLPVSDALKPDGTAPDGGQLQKIFLEGVLYTAGTVALGGNAGVYGSVVAQRGFGGGGTPDIYYNARLAQGLELRNGDVPSVFEVIMQQGS